METLHDILRRRLYDHTGLSDPKRLLSFEDADRQTRSRLEWIFRECQLKLLQAHYRYGDNNGKVVMSFVPDIERCLGNYKKTKNIEYLFDVINYCELEINYARDPEKHWERKDDEDHSNASLDALNTP